MSYGIDALDGLVECSVLLFNTITSDYQWTTYLFNVFNNDIVKLANALEEIGEVLALVGATDGTADLVPLFEELLDDVASLVSDGGRWG